MDTLARAPPREKPERNEPQVALINIDILGNAHRGVEQFSKTDERRNGIARGKEWPVRFQFETKRPLTRDVTYTEKIVGLARLLGLRASLSAKRSCARWISLRPQRSGAESPKAPNNTRLCAVCCGPIPTPAPVRARTGQSLLTMPRHIQIWHFRVRARRAHSRPTKCATPSRSA